MVSLGAVRLDRALETSFYGRFAPLPSADFDGEALAVSGTRREDHLAYPDPLVTMQAFDGWLTEVNGASKPTFVSDNPAFDWQFVNYYFHRYLGRNPMGFSARRIGDLYAGMLGDASKASEWKSLRRTAHTHHPVDDARGNAEALLVMADRGLRIPGLR